MGFNHTDHLRDQEWDRNQDMDECVLLPPIVLTLTPIPVLVLNKTNGCAWDTGISWFSTILTFPTVKFLNFEMKKKLLSSIWNYCVHLAEQKKRWNLIKFWTWMIYGKIYDYFPMPNGIFLWIFTCKNYFALGRTFQNLGKPLKIYLSSTPNVITLLEL